MSTIFAKIIAGEIPATVVYEDDTVLAFLDINPINHGHTLVVPKEASEDARVAAPETLAHMMRVAQNIAVACTNSLKCDGVNFLMNAGEAAGQEVLHTHLHVIPRYAGDGNAFITTHTSYQDGEADAVADKIKAAL